MRACCAVPIHMRAFGALIPVRPRLPGVRAVITTRMPRWSGAGAVAGGRQYSDAIKETTRQRRYIFNNPVRCVGDAVAAVMTTDRHIAEQALALIKVDYELLLYPGTRSGPGGRCATHLAGRESGACLHNNAAPVVADHGDLAAEFAAADQVFEQRYDTGFVHNAQLEPRCALAHWRGTDADPVYPLQGIANYRHDAARDLGLEDQHVRVVCNYMGGGFGNKNQNQDADLIAATPSATPTRRSCWNTRAATTGSACASRWPTVQQYKVGVTNDGTVTAIQLIGYSGMGPYRKNAGGIGGLELYACPIGIVRSRRCIPIAPPRAISVRRLNPMGSMASNRSWMTSPTSSGWTRWSSP